MKKLLAAAVLLMLCAFAQPQQMYAQRYGVPACATCITPRNPTPGVPGSATSSTAPNPPGFTAFNPPPSIGFTAFNPPPSYGVGSPSFRASLNVNGHGRGDFGGRGHRRRNNFGVPFGYAYPVYVPVETEAAPEPVADVPSGNAMDREMWSRAAEREDHNIERSDVAAAANASSSDPRYGEHYLDGREAGRAVASGPDAALAREEDNGPSVVLMLHDGTRVELGNYAIVGQTIYDLGAGHHKKIALADLDVPATQKANDALGLDFKLPTR